MHAARSAAAVLLPLLAAACAPTPPPPPPPPPAAVAPLELPPADAVGGRLLVFVQPGASDLARAFEAEHWPALRALAEEEGVAASLVDARAGAPAEITLTPQLVFQNHLGRSVFQGRYDDLGRVGTFLRTARRRPQGDGALTRRELPVRDLGRARVAAPVKVGDVTGSPPAGYDSAAFKARARAAIAAGLRDWTWSARLDAGRGDRAFYWDFYPWLSEGGTLYLSTAVYSQFHCKEPVYRSDPDDPFTGDWDERDEVFAEAARSLERVVAEQLAGSPRGDGFDALPDAVPVVTWSALGLALPPAPDGAALPVGDGPLPRRWRLPADDPTAFELVFDFPPPLDMYGGEVGDVRARLQLGAAGLADASGEVQVVARTVTLGEPSLDAWVHGPVVLKADEHPRPSFTLEGLVPSDGELAWGRPAPFAAEGTFAMAGRSAAVGVRAQAEPWIDDAGRVRLRVSGGFHVPLVRVWEIEVPVGEPPANETLVFDFVFDLVEDD